MESQKIFEMEMTCFVTYFLYYDVIIERSCQHFGNAVNIKVGIHTTM